jgi:CRP/FNR family transcriptional regulator, polysaccharide utilization system transcription regulator
METEEKQFPCYNCNCQSSLFKSLSKEELNMIGEGRYSATYKAGEILFKQGTPSPYFICLTKGLAKIYIEGYGKNLILSLVKPVDYIFGPGVYVDNIHHYSAAAVEDTTACLVDVNIYKKLIRQNPDFAEEFIQRVSQQAIFNFKQVVSLTQKQMPGRIADVLFYLKDEIYGKNPFNLSISRQDLADLSGMSKESAIRILKELKEEAIITVNGPTIEIINEKQLRQISQTG